MLGLFYTEVQYILDVKAIELKLNLTSVAEEHLQGLSTEPFTVTLLILTSCLQTITNTKRSQHRQYYSS